LTIEALSPTKGRPRMAATSRRIWVIMPPMKNKSMFSYKPITEELIKEIDIKGKVILRHYNHVIKTLSLLFTRFVDLQSYQI